ncbi:MAG: GntR family transcriptional regulator [Tranquillimonas sp.]
MESDAPLAEPGLRRPASLTALVRDELERLILAGEFSAGTRLSEQALAERMGVSRGPIREAARLLEREGLVRAVTNQGVFVRHLSTEEALELYELRAVIAGHACASLARTLRPAQAAELTSYLEAMEDCIARGDEGRYFTLNIEFHDAMISMSGKSRTVELYKGLGKEVRLLRRRVLTGQASMRLSNDEHRRIVAALAAGDSARAGAEANEHHMNARQRVLKTMT